MNNKPTPDTALIIAAIIVILTMINVNTLINKQKAVAAAQEAFLLEQITKTERSAPYE